MKKIPELLIIGFLMFCCGSDGNMSKSDIEAARKVEVESKISLNSYDSMQFSQKILKAKANQEITLTLYHKGIMNKQIMGHNFVLLKKNVDVESFARKAMLAKDNDFITDESDVIAYTRLIGGGESDTIVFTIEKPGVYIYLCTFPGHSQLMRGKLLIE